PRPPGRLRPRARRDRPRRGHRQPTAGRGDHHRPPATGPHPSADRRTRSDRRHPITTGDDPMIDHTVRVHRSAENLAREYQLAWKMDEVAVDPVEVESEVAEMIINRISDTAELAVPSLSRAPTVAARPQARRHRVPT